MLGIKTPDSNWQWAACGKHPSYRDFISVGRMFPLACNFSDWIEKGYPALAKKENSIQTLHSWRFWTRTTVKNQVACGLMRDSSDSIGRPFPFLIMGCGILGGWMENWELLPGGCEEAWGRMERISAQTFRDISALERELATLPIPSMHWNDIRKSDLANRNINGTCSNEVEIAGRSDSGHILLGEEAGNDSVISLCRSLRNRIDNAPSSLFIGGTLESTYCAFFRRPLNSADFTTLWSNNSKGQQAP